MARQKLNVRDVEAAVLSVQGVQGGRNTRYEVSLSDGNTYSTFDGQLAQKVYGFVNQQASVRVSQTPSRDGDILFDNVDDIAPPGQLPQMAMPAQAGTPAQIPIAGQQPQNPGGQIPMAQGGGGRGGMSDEDKARISRLGASGTAFEFVGSLYAGMGPEALPDAVKYSKMLTAEILAHGWTGSWSGQVPGDQPETAQAVAQQVNDVAGEGTVQTGAEIPWEQ